MSSVSRVLALTFALAISLPVGPAAASSLPRAASASSGNLLTLHSETGDYVGGGVDRSFTDANASFSTLYFDGTYLRVWVTRGELSDPDAEWWTAEVAAAPGATLVAGSYPNARRAPFRGEAPGLDISGDGRGCNEVYGEFDVDTASYDEWGSIVALDLRFTQHCESPESPTLSGELRLGAAALELGATIGANAGLRMRDRSVTVSGTVSCTAPVTTTILGSLEQARAAGSPASATFSTEVACTPEAPVAWTASARAATRPAFRPGPATVHLEVSALDPVYGKTVSTSVSSSLGIVARPMGASGAGGTRTP